MNTAKKTQKHNPQSLILVDADGVLLNWEYAFAIWMEQHGHEQQPGGEFIYDIGERYGITKDQGRKLIKMFNENGYTVEYRKKDTETQPAEPNPS